jgi:FG-GAP repeat
MKLSFLLAWIPILYLLLTGSQCTEVVVTTQVDSSQKISAKHGNFNGGLDSGDHWGAAVANIGDLEGDGVTDLAVGAPGDDDNGDNRGAAWILFLNSNGTVDMSTKTAENVSGFTGGLDNGDQFGSAVAGIGDLNGDGFRDIAVGAPLDDDGGTDRGALWILFMNADGTVAGNAKISDKQGGFSGNLQDGEQFASAVTLLGDLDGDGNPDLAVGAPLAFDNDTRKGAVWILFMNSDGTVREGRKISEGDNGFHDSLSVDDHFGSAVAGIGDLDGDGIPDLAVGADQADAGGSNRGAIWILFMKSNGTVRDQRRIASDDGGFQGKLDDEDHFGCAVAAVGDQNEDGVDDLAVGADMDDDGGTDRGAVWVLFMKTDGKVKGEAKISNLDGKFKENLDDGDEFGAALAGLGNLNGDKNDDIAVGAPLDDDGKIDAGAVYILFMERHKDEKRTGFFSGS